MLACQRRKQMHLMLETNPEVAQDVKCFDLTLFVKTLPLSSGFWASGNNFFLFGFVGGFFFSLGKTWPARGSGDRGRFPLAGRTGRGWRRKAATPRGVTGTGSATSFSVPNGSQRFLPFQNRRSFFLNLLTSRLVTSFLLSLIFRFSFRWSGQSKKRCLKPNYFKKQRSSSSFLLTWGRYAGLKWPWCLSWLF